MVFTGSEPAGDSYSAQLERCDSSRGQDVGGQRRRCRWGRFNDVVGMWAAAWWLVHRCYMPTPLLMELVCGHKQGLKRRVGIVGMTTTLQVMEGFCFCFRYALPIKEGAITLLMLGCKMLSFKLLCQFLVCQAWFCCYPGNPLSIPDRTC